MSQLNEGKRGKGRKINGEGKVGRGGGRGWGCDVTYYCGGRFAENESRGGGG